MPLITDTCDQGFQLHLKYMMKGELKYKFSVTKIDIVNIGRLSPVQTVLVSVMDSKVAARMGSLHADWLAPVLPTVMVVVHTELALFTVQIGKSSAASSVANTHGQKETKQLNRERYKEFLEYTLPVLLHHVPLAIRRNTYFMYDGAFVHFSVNVRRFLNQRFHDRWIGRDGPIP
ncbi:hypothetical protein ANN_20198 [Periplaneta americana]|uniref:Uncharacterized protein n=1 Tax=Periplaneta americana TaxID=6978 RepID=A0ABQ8SCM2_PERAM|nr:hypothetical protein ANN_20198 [Periplaneta americana]